MDRVIIVSADSHAGPKISAYKPYLENKHQSALEDLQRENDEFVAITSPFSHFPDEALDVIDERDAIRGGGLEGAWSVSRRLKEMDAEGVAAEIIHPGHQESTLPFFSTINRPCSAELRAAGTRAYHRWLADRLAESGGRSFGVAEPGPCHDMNEAVRELHWTADHGFVSMAVPRAIEDASLPPLHDPYYEPFWRVCEERSIVLSVHAGWGQKQGGFFDFADQLARQPGLKEDIGRGNVAAMTEVLKKNFLDSAESPLFLEVGPRRVLWQLMFGGVFDRHRALKIAFTEIRADWLPATLRVLDDQFEHEGAPLAMKPSEYFRRHCYATPSSIRPTEIAIRDQIGVGRLMFGLDYPHPEGTWPNTWNWIRATFNGVSEQDARLILGENAIRCYGLDRARLTEIAARIGPEPDDILGRPFEVDPKVVEHFTVRSGYAKDAEQIDGDRLGRLVAADMRAALRNPRRSLRRSAG